MSSRTKWLLVVWLSLALFVLACGCGPKAGKEPTPEPSGFADVEQSKGPKEMKEKAPPPLPAEDYFIHKVKWPGESLSIIAKWYIGRLKDWKLLAKHNPELNPNQIYVGDAIRIPKSRMQTQDPMPREFVEQFVSPAKDEEKAAEAAKEPPDAAREPPTQDEAEGEQPAPEKPAQSEEDHSEEEPEDLELFGPKGLENE
jgi:LysM repeat protein